MGKTLPRITLNHNLNDALEALARAKNVKKNDLIEGLLRQSLVTTELMAELMKMIKVLAEQSIQTSDDIRAISEFVADRNADSDD